MLQRLLTYRVDTIFVLSLYYIHGLCPGDHIGQSCARSKSSVECYDAHVLWISYRAQQTLFLSMQTIQSTGYFHRKTVHHCFSTTAVDV